MVCWIRTKDSDGGAWGRAGRFVSPNTLNALKIHGSDWKFRMIGWSSTKFTVYSGAEMTFHLYPGGRNAFHKNRGSFQLLMSSETWHWVAVLFSLWGRPIGRKTRMSERAGGIQEWRAEPMLLFYSGQSYFGSSSPTFVRLSTSQKLVSKSKRKIYPSSSAILGCHHGTEGFQETVTSECCGAP